MSNPLCRINNDDCSAAGGQIQRHLCSTHRGREDRHGDPLVVLQAHEQHGMSDTSEYISWKCLIQRTTSPNSKAWKYYGGRGITVCDRWHSFSAFYEDMGPKPEPKRKYSIERKDVNGPYCKDNCEWADKATQSSNRRKQKGCSSWFRGVSWHKAAGKWLAQITVNGRHKYLGLFDSEEEAAAVYEAERPS